MSQLTSFNMLIKPIEKTRSTSTRHLRISNSSLGISNGVSEDTDIHAAWPNKPGVTMVHLGNEKVPDQFNYVEPEKSVGE